MEEYNDASESMYRPTTLRGLLLYVQNRAELFHADADRALFERLDTASSQEFLREKARLVARLPEMIAELRNRGGEVPESVIPEITVLAANASDALQRDSTIAMRVLLLPPNRDAREGDPGPLDVIMDRLAAGSENPERYA